MLYSDINPAWNNMLRQRYLNQESPIVKINCPCCGELLVYANLGDGAVDVYCEDCGWPDEDRESEEECAMAEEEDV